MGSNVPVTGWPTIEGQGDAAEPLRAAVGIEQRGDFDLTKLILVMRMETGTVWELELDPAAAGYLAGGIAFYAGVNFERS